MYEIITFEEDSKTNDGRLHHKGQHQEYRRQRYGPAKKKTTHKLWCFIDRSQRYKTFLEEQRIQAPPQATQLVGSAQEKQAPKHMTLKINEGYVQKTKEKPTLKGIMRILTQYENQHKNTRYESA